MNDMSELLAEAQRRTGASEVSLRCQMPNLETVYLSVSPDGFVAHDDCATYELLSSAHREGSEPWSETLAARLCAQRGVELTQAWLSDPDDEAVPRIQRAIGTGDDPATAIAAVADAIDAVFDGHRAERLRWRH
jgi:hypothetical protein